MENILDVKNLSVLLDTREKQSLLVDNVSFSLRPGECLGILGESGSGKSLTVKSILGLLDSSFKISGEAFYKNNDLLQESKENLRKIRGRSITMVLQNPMTCFDQLCRVGDQIGETFAAHLGLEEKAIREKAILTLEKMLIRDPEEVLEKFPHQLSGGMLQRIMIGIATAMEPDLLVADEPTTAIDAITQYEILEEFLRIKNESNTAVIFITHDLGVVSKLADKIIVMSKGKVVDRGDFKHIVTAASDSYTRLLVEKRTAVMRRYRQFVDTPGGEGRC